jgi:hypothetical protein
MFVLFVWFSGCGVVCGVHFLSTGTLASSAFHTSHHSFKKCNIGLRGLLHHTGSR